MSKPLNVMVMPIFCGQHHKEIVSANMTCESKILDLANRLTGDIEMPDFYYLIEATANSYTSGLYEVVANEFSYHNNTVGIFKKYLDEIRSILGGKGIVLIYKNNGTTDVKEFPFYNKELGSKKVFDLIIYQEFGIKPKDERGKSALEESLKKEKIKSTLVYACYQNNMENILSRVANASVTQLNKLYCSTTPLGFCAQHDNLEAFKRLVASGADLTKVTVLKNSALEYAFSKSPSIVEYIYDNYYDQFRDEVEKKGFSLAYHTKDAYLLKLVLQSGASLDLPNSPFPPLHCFADNDNVNGIKFLLEHGADINTLNKLKETALDRAKRRNNTRSIEVLSNYT